jgi:protein-tyrosine phosphatase
MRARGTTSIRSTTRPRAAAGGIAKALTTGIVVGGLLVSGLVAAPTAGAARAPAVTNAAVERTDSGQLEITWTTSKGQQVTKILSGTDPDHIDHVLVASVPKGDHAATVDDPSPGARPYLALVASDGSKQVVAERRITLEGDSNFRDLGGYRTTDGRTVRWGRLYRSGELDGLTDADLQTIHGLGIKLVCDLRSPSEVSIAPDRTPTGATTLSVPIFDKAVDPAVVRQQVLSGDVSSLGAPGELLLDANRKFVTSFGKEYSKVMQRVMDPAFRPALVHCSAGKDRAGLASAIVLLTLGVPKKTVMQDYLLSNKYRAADNARALSSVSAILDPAGVDVIKSLLDVRPEYLNAAFDAMVKKYGSIDNYLRKGLGISDAARARFQRQMLQ